MENANKSGHILLGTDPPTLTWDPLGGEALTFHGHRLIQQSFYGVLSICQGREVTGTQSEY